MSTVQNVRRLRRAGLVGKYRVAIILVSSVLLGLAYVATIAGFADRFAETWLPVAMIFAVPAFASLAIFASPTAMGEYQASERGTSRDNAIPGEDREAVSPHEVHQPAHDDHGDEE